MLKITLSVITFVTLTARAEDLPVASVARYPTVCGVYLIEDYGDMEVHSLTDLSSRTGRQVHYTIQNVESELVQQLFANRCYCVRGPIQLDPVFKGDRDFRTITVQSVTRSCKSPL